MAESGSTAATSQPKRPAPRPPTTLAQNQSRPIESSDALLPKTVAPVSYRQVQDSPESLQSFKMAREKIAAGQSAEALPYLEAYLKEQPTGQYADEAAFFLGRTAYAQNEFDKALADFTKVVSLNPPSKLRGQAYYLKAMCESQLNSNREALASLANIDPKEIPSNQKYSLFEAWGTLASREGRGLESTLAYIKALKETEEPEKKSKIQASVVDQVNNRLNEAELQFLIKEYPSEFPVAEAEMRLASIKLASGQREEARDLLSRVALQSQPGSPLHLQASEQLKRLDTAFAANAERIGALLPLSGDQESLGRAISDGLHEAFAKSGHNNLELVLADAGPNVDSAKAAFERLVSEDKVMAVIGPLAGSQAEAVAAKAMEMGVPNVSMAARSGLVEQRPYVFRVALTPAKQVQAIVAYSHEKLNARHFAILFSKDNFGREFATEYFKAVNQWGSDVTAAETYEPDQSDFRVLIENMVGMGFPNFRKTEADDRVKLQEEKLDRKLTRKETETFGPQPIVDFDVLMIPDTFRAVGQIVPALLYANVTAPKLTGPSTWHNPKLLQRAGQYLDGALFVDLFAPERQGASTRNFVDQFQADHGAIPSSLAAVGYDIGTAIKLAYGNGNAPSSRDELRARLESLGSFEGACGLYDWDVKHEPLAEVQLFTVKRGAFSHQGGIVIKNPKN